VTADKEIWLQVVRRYFGVVVAGNLLWEFAHLPLYTLWWEGNFGQITFAAIHCTGGDILIAATCFLGALLLLGTGQWPRECYMAVATLTIVAGVIYTIFSEWHNTEQIQSWAYSEFMPKLPLIGTGLSPLAQWIVIPLGAFWWAHRCLPFTIPATQAATETPKLR
jgi:hypothetical protein